MISILMSCKNHNVYTRLAIQRIIECTKNEFELIIADDSDIPVENEVADELRTWGGKYKILRPDIRRSGVAQARNDALRAANSEFAINVDNDVIVTSGWDEAIVRFLQDDPKIGLLMPMDNAMYFFEPKIDFLNYCNIFKRMKIESSTDFQMEGPSGLKIAIDKTYGGSLDEFAKRYVEERKDWKLLDFRNTWGCWATRMDTIREIGGYDENYLKAGYEDLDLAWRFNLCDYRTVVTFRSFVHHCMSITRLSVAGAAEAEAKNEEYYRKKFATPNLNPKEHWI